MRSQEYMHEAECRVDIIVITRWEGRPSRGGSGQWVNGSPEWDCCRPDRNVTLSSFSYR